MKRDIGSHGLKLVKGYETFVPWVYDDKIPMHRDPTTGRHQYAEWMGAPVRGTLTIGYGHTDAAAHPLKIKQGLRITEEEALEVLHVDLAECVEQVNAAVKVPVTQGQADALYSFNFNCGQGNTKRLVAPLNRGDYDRCRGDFGHYVRSRGEVMHGLENRRHAEQALWDDRYEEAASRTPEPDDADVLDTHSKQVDERPTIKPAPAPSHVAPTAIAVGTAGAAEVGSHLNDALSTVKDTHDTLSSMFGAAVSDPMLWVALAIVIGVAILWRARHPGEETQ